MNAWTLENFNDLRRDLDARGLLRDFLAVLPDVVSPDGELTLFEAVDLSTPEHWREAQRLLEERADRQLDLL